MESLNKKYSEGIILSKNNVIPTHIKYNNVLAVGDAGCGKSRNVIEPNILQMNSSYVISDTNDNYYKKYSKLLKENGYKIRVLDFYNFDDTISNLYNPFVYLTDDDSIESLVDCLFVYKKFKHQGDNDTYFENCEKLLFSACIHYLLDFCTDESKKNFSGLRDLICSFAEYENDTDEKFIGEKLFENLPTESRTYQLYAIFKKATGKLFKGCIISACARLCVFSDREIANLTRTDTVEIRRLGDEKTALFIIVHPSSKSFSFLTSILYSQIFETLKNIVATRNKQLTFPVRCLMDEFVNFCFIPNFEKMLAICNIYNISYMITIQDLDQIARIYQDWECIADDCPTQIFLGAYGKKTLEYFSNKFTTFLVQRNNKFYLTFLRKIIYTPDKILKKLRSLSPDECIIFMLNEKPIKDKKYYLENHPNYKKINSI